MHNIQVYELKINVRRMQNENILALLTARTINFDKINHVRILTNNRCTYI